MAEGELAGDHVTRTYSDEYFFGGGAGYLDYLGEAGLLRAAGRRYGRILQRHTEPGRLLDVGAAAGLVLKGYEDSGWQGVGLEPNSTMARWARDRLALNVANCSLEDFVPSRTFDVVSLIQVIAHFRDPRAALSRCSDLVREGGYVLIETWDRLSLTARSFGRDWHEYSPPSVLHWFSVDGVRRLGASLGLQSVARGRPRKMLSIGHAKSLLAYKSRESLVSTIGSGILKRLPDRLTVPYPFDDVFWILLKKKIA